MKEARIYVEGGGTAKSLRKRCEDGFRRLLENCGFTGRMPRIIACGSRNETYKRFKADLRQGKPGFVAMLVDSEDVVADINKPWAHLKARKYDRWERPAGASDDQVFLMTTCIETWIAADRNALQRHYGDKLQIAALPPTHDLEARHRHDVQECLANATRDCKNSYAKGERSFEPLAELEPHIYRKTPAVLCANAHHSGRQPAGLRRNQPYETTDICRPAAFDSDG